MFNNDIMYVLGGSLWWPLCCRCWRLWFPWLLCFGRWCWKSLCFWSFWRLCFSRWDFGRLCGPELWFRMLRLSRPLGKLSFRYLFWRWSTFAGHTVVTQPCLKSMRLWHKKLFWTSDLSNVVNGVVFADDLPGDWLIAWDTAETSCLPFLFWWREILWLVYCSFPCMAFFGTEKTHNSSCDFFYPVLKQWHPWKHSRSVPVAQIFNSSW